MNKMYYRIFNKLDAETIGREVISSDNRIVAERIKETIAILDDNYGSYRKSFDMGGSVLYFPTIDNYISNIDNIKKFYGLHDELCEYDEIIEEKVINNIEWHERLWMLSSDDAVTIIFPKEVDKNV